MNQLSEIFMADSTSIADGFVVEELNRRGFSLKLLARDIPSKPINSTLNYVAGDFNQLMLLDQLNRNNDGIIHYACASLRIMPIRK
jgi:hypothetical protein